MNPDRYNDIPFLMPLASLPNEYLPESESVTTTTNTKERPAIYKEQKLPLLSNLYVASLTVVGLFIVFRFVQRSR